MLENTRGNGAHQISLQMTPQEFPQSTSSIMIPPNPSDQRAPTRFSGLAPDTYAVSGWPNGSGYIASMRCGSVNLLRDDLTLALAAAPPPIEVTLRDDGAQLTVKTMENGRPAIAGVVIFSREYPKRTLLAGSVYSTSISNLAPGTYHVMAMRGAESLEFRNPIAMERYLAHAREVNLGPRGDVTIEVEVQAPEQGEEAP